MTSNSIPIQYHLGGGLLVVKETGDLIIHVHLSIELHCLEPLVVADWSIGN